MTTPGGNLAKTEALQRSTLVSDVEYEIALDVSKGAEPASADSETFLSETVLRFRCSRPGSSTFLDLSARSVERLVVNGRDLPPGDLFSASEARLQLPDLAERNEVRVLAHCEYQNTGVGLQRFVDPADQRVYLSTQSEPFDAHRFFACFDQPDLKAAFSLRVQAPPDWTVVSNSAVSGRDGGRWEFAPTPPLSTYLLAVVAGPYESVLDRHGDIELGLYCRQSMRPYLEHEELFELTRQGLDWFAEVFDFPYPFGKYDQLYVPEFAFGAMENPGCVTFSERHLFRGQVTGAERESRANTLLHEMAHMWFGDLVTMRWWDDLWLNESFATFMATLACSRATRFRNAWVTFANEEKAWARYQDQLPTTHPISTEVPDTDAVHQNFDGITYAKGASVLRQLVAWVGEEPFLEGCRRYFRRYQYGNAELRDFLAELELASGRDLSTWAKEWLQTSNLNTLGPRVEIDGGRYTAFSVEQTAPEEWPTLRSHRVGVGLYDLESPDTDGSPAEAGASVSSGGSSGAASRLARRSRVELDVLGPSSDVPTLVGQAAADLVLVNDGDLTFAKLRFDERSLRTLVGHLAAMDDPLSRTLCWSATWDMVRDGAMPARQFVALVRNNLWAETDIGVLQTLQMRALTAMEFYGDPANAAALLGELANDALRQLEEAVQGSDRQLAWARHWISAARQEQHVSKVRALLEGEYSVPGLEVDTELRWQAVRALAGVGAIDDSAIDAEYERDHTDAGERNAEAARASRPDPEVKAAAWRRLLEEPDLSHALMKAIMGGFVRRDQEELIRPYVPRYFEVLERIWAERQLEVAIAFTQRMYPSVVVDEDVVARTDRYLQRDVPGPLRRSLLEERDTLVRALRARALDASAATAVGAS